MAPLKRLAKGWLEQLRLPAAAKAAQRADRKGPFATDPGPERAIAECLAWIGRAQDCSRTKDGGVARHYSLIDGWAPSYPETTGYIVATLIAAGESQASEEWLVRARRMLDWLLAIQFPEGGFQGGMVTQTPRVPVTFNTGQILIGLAAGAHLGARYRDAMVRAADWLVQSQDPDGCWRRHPTPFAEAGEKVYETHVSLGLFRAHTVEPGRSYQAAATKQVDWALKGQAPNGWLANCCLSDPVHPLTHTLGYALRGIVEAFLSTGDQRYLAAAQKTADGLLSALRPDGTLPGRLDSAWRASADYVCLTGASQVAESWLLLNRATKRDDYLRAARLTNSFVRRTILIDGAPEVRGGVKGSYPVDGDYGRWQYLNWAAKFTIDANLAELGRF